MANGPRGAAGALQMFSDNEVSDASFKLEEATEGNEPARKLYLRTFKLTNANARIWHERPESEWPLLATVLPSRIIMHPIHVNPHAQRYLSPKNGRFTTVIYEDSYEHQLPNDAEVAASQIALRLAWGIFDSPDRGLGLNRDLDAVWQSLSRLQEAEILAINQRPGLHIDGHVVSICESEMDKLRRAFNRTKDKGRKLIRQTKQSIVHDEVLTRLDPERFRRVVRVAPTLVEVRRENARQVTDRERAARQSSVRAVRKQLGELAAEAPNELMMLHAEIERATLTAMIEKYRGMLQMTLSESQWQRFFEQNKFVLSIAFSRPVELAHTQFHAQGSGLTGSGAQIGDFLFNEHGQALAIVEIKTPETDLIQASPYRKPNVFGPHPKLSGAVTQVLHQQSELRTRWMYHVHDNSSLRERRPDVIKCVVVAGKRPTEEGKLRSFEVFRNACKDVEIITFDELLEKLEFLQKHLLPPSDDVPF